MVLFYISVHHTIVCVLAYVKCDDLQSEIQKALQNNGLALYDSAFIYNALYSKWKSKTLHSLLKG